MDYLQTVASYLANGLIMGSIYGLMAIGLTLILGVLKIVNFAHGELYMWTAYIAYLGSTIIGLSAPVSIVIALVFIFVLGMAIERSLLTPLYTGKLERPDEYALLITFGLSVFLINLALLIFGPYQKASPALASGVVHIGFLSIGTGRLLAAGIAIAMMVILLLILMKTSIGTALRAIAQDREVATVMGVDVNRISPLAFGIGSLLAGAAGALLGPVFLVFPTMGSLPAVKSFVILVLGGMGSIKGALYGALLLGIVENLGVLWLSPSYRDVYGFLIMIGVLLLKPTGLFGGDTL